MIEKRKNLGKSRATALLSYHVNFQSIDLDRVQRLSHVHGRNAARYAGHRIHHQRVVHGIKEHERLSDSNTRRACKGFVAKGRC